MSSLNAHNAAHGSVFPPIVRCTENATLDLVCERRLRSAQRQQARDDRLPFGESLKGWRV